MSRKKKGETWGENGFEHWGGYMAAKKTKLEEQFHNTARKKFKESSSKLFEGIAIFVNGYTDPTADDLKHLMMTHGGVYHHYMRPKITTHIIASNLPYSKITVYRKCQNPIPICKPQWITDSIAAGKVLNFQNYLLYSKDTNIQPQIAFKSDDPKNMFNINPAIHGKQNIEKSEISMNTNINTNNLSSGRLLKCNTINDAKHNIISTIQSSNVKINAQSTRDSEFLSAFYNNSRLHYIATMRSTFKNYVNDLRDKNNGVFLGLERLMRLKEEKALSSCQSDSEDDTIFSEISRDYDKVEHKKESVIMHIDMDCFFVSVGIRNKPELRDLPVAVTHAKGNMFSTNYDGEEFGSLSEVASCSYAARKAGVKNGMFLGEALKMCPNLKTIQYDFEGYEEVSYVLYDTVASYTLDIEAVSCDEMYADCTKILDISGFSPLEFATIIRKEIKQKTNCPVSTGFGNNKLQARLATRKAKPDNQFYLKSKCVEMYIRDLDVRDLPGVGGSTTHKLNEINVHICEELQKIPVGVLQKEFGKKMGEQLYKMCRGIDDTKLNLEHVRKSVSAEVNYGIRFQNNNDAIDFLKKLSMEVCDRLTAAHAKGRCITLKLMVRAEEAPKETAKFMGHGPCNHLTRSKNLMTPINDVNIIEKEVINIWNQLRLTPEDMRGVGIQISRLEISNNKHTKANLINFFSKIGKSQRCDKILDVGTNEQYPHCSKKVDNLKASITAESSLTIKKPSDSKVDNLLLESTQFFEPTEIFNEHQVIATVQKDVQAEQLIFPIKTNHKRLHDYKANEIITHKSRNMAGESSKGTTQKQTLQENFFKYMKSNREKLSKYEIPRIQDIDISVLIELPEDIRNEILNEYKTKKKSFQVSAAASTANTVDPINEILHKEVSNVQDLCSQIDPDVLTVLMESDLHPDVQRDVQIYCNMKTEENRLNLKRINQNDSIEHLQKADPFSTCDDNKNLKSNTNKNHVKKDICILQKDTVLYAKDELDKKDNIDKTESTSYENHIEISHNNAVADKADTFILQNLNILHNNENVDKHQEMLINLVNHLFALPLQQVKMQIQTWVTKSKSVNEVDFLSLATFFSMLPQKKRIEDLHVLLKTMHRCTTETGDCIWHRTYRRTVKHVQHYMQIEYNSNLMVPSIRCNDSRCNNGD